MSTERRFAAPGSELVPGAELSLDAEAARHARVLRLGQGDPVRVFDGRGAEADAEVVALEAAALVVRVVALRAASAASARVTLVQCLPKGAKLEDIVRAATEAGAHTIALAISTHAVSRPDEARGERRATRLARIAEEAARQSERAHVPEVTPPAPLLEVARRAPPGALRLSLSPRATRRWDAALPEHATEAWLVVGPEGGLSSEEERALEALGYTSVRIDVGVLRVETAAPVAVAMLVDRLAR